MNTTSLTATELKQGTWITNFVFTLNNWTQLEYDAIIRLDSKWIVVAKETGKEGTPHLQGAVCLNKNMRFSTLKKKPGFERAHIEKMRGTPRDSFKYCTKEDKDPFLRGDMPESSQGKRNDLLTVVEQIKANPNIEALCRESDDFSAMFIKYTKGITQFSSLMESSRVGPPTVLWIYGPTGSGKTRSAVEFGMATNMSMWISSGSLQWFDGYRGQRIAILDDLRSGHCKFSFLLRLLDRYPFSVPIKGSFANWKPDVIIITAPLSPREMFDLKREGDIAQLERRITHLVQSPVAAKQLLAFTSHTGRRGETPVVDQSLSMSRDDGILLKALGATSEESLSSTEELSEEEQKDLKRKVNPDAADINIRPSKRFVKKSSVDKRADHHLAHFNE